jgi:hypothetical protein
VQAARLIAGDEVVEVAAPNRLLLQREMLVGATLLIGHSRPRRRSLGADHDCTLSPRHQPLAFLSPLPYLSAMLSSAYLSRKLTSPIPTKDGGTLRTIGEACEYMAAIGKERELCRHWQQVRELMLREADVAALSSRLRLAVLKDAKLDVTALSEPIERWIDEPSPGLLSNGKLNVVEVDEPPTEPAESNERSDSDSKQERRRQEELQQAEARQAAEEERRRQEELQQAEARQAAEEKRRRQEAENKPSFWNRFLAMLHARDS